MRITTMNTDNFTRASSSRISVIRDGHSITRSAKIPKPVVLVDTREYAYLYFLSGIGRIPTWLVNVYFVNDPYRPTSQAQWEDFLTDVKLEFAGQRDFKHPLAADVLLEAKA